MKKRQTKEKEIKCAYCGGKGIDPFGLLHPGAKCQVCEGRGRVSIAVFEDKLVECRYCRGTGKHPFTRMTCSACKGKGVIIADKKSTETCPECKGTGSTFQKNLPCSRCGGTGTIVPERGSLWQRKRSKSLKKKKK